MYYSRFKEVLDIPKEHNGDIKLNEINTITTKDLTSVYGNESYDIEYLNYLTSKFNIPSLDTVIDSKSYNCYFT